MGAFFTSVQVRLGDASVDPLLDALRRGAGEVDEVESDEEADRIVLVLPPDSGGWTAVYDQRTESQQIEALEALGRLVSSACDAPAISVLVHDSDVLDLRLFAAGERVDRFDSFPGYFEGEATEAQKREAAGHPERWADVLAVDAVALAAIWRDEALFAEDTLRRTCDAIGCAPTRALLGYRYATQQGLVPDGAIRLRFRSRERPAHEKKRTGPPVLELHSHYGEVPVRLAVGDELRLGFSARSVGGEGRGLSVVAWGETIERRLIEIETFELLVGDLRAGSRHQKLTPVEAQSAGGTVFASELSGQVVPAGSAAELDLRPGADVSLMMRAMASATVHVNVVGRVVGEGRGTLGVGFVPHDNPDHGQVGTVCCLDISPRLRRPLRFESHRYGQTSHLLRPLAGGSQLDALIVFGATRADAVEAVVPWLADAPPAGAETAVYRLDPQKRPKTWSGALDPKRVLKDMREELTVALTARGWSLSFGTGVLSQREELRVPCVRASTVALEAIDTWRRRIDGAFASGLLLQAALYRSDPTGESPDVTAYESACGTAHGVTTLRSWCERWVRVPGDLGLWLGKALASRIDDETRHALAAVAELEAVPGGLRITLVDRARMDDFEHALAGLLPLPRGRPRGDADALIGRVTASGRAQHPREGAGDGVAHAALVPAAGPHAHLELLGDAGGRRLRADGGALNGESRRAVDEAVDVVVDEAARGVDAHVAVHLVLRDAEVIGRARDRAVDGHRDGVTVDPRAEHVRRAREAEERQELVEVDVLDEPPEVDVERVRRDHQRGARRRREAHPAHLHDAGVAEVELDEVRCAAEVAERDLHQHEPVVERDVPELVHRRQDQHGLDREFTIAPARSLAESRKRRTISGT